MDRRREAVAYGLLFSLPSGVAAVSLADNLTPAEGWFAVGIGVVVGLIVFAFVLLLALTGEPDRGSETP